MDRGRDADIADGPDQLVGPSPPDEAAFLDQALDDLLDEEGIAAAALPHQLGHPVERGVGTEEVPEQLATGVIPEG